MPRAVIVEAVAAASPDAMRRQRDASRADLVELRLDLLDRPDADAALAGRSRPVIATCRAAWEGGRFQGSEAERLAILTRALALGADYVDLEWKAAAALEHWPAEARARVVLSSHDFEGVPADLADRVRDMRRHGTGVVKVAVTAEDAPRCAAGHRRRPGRSRRAASAPSSSPWARRASPRASCPSTSARAGPTAATASRPGRSPSIGCATSSASAASARRRRSTRVVGRPIGHSVSPAMHNAAFARHRHRRRLPAVRGGRLRRLPRARRRARHRRRQRDRAVQGRRGADGGRSRRRAQHAAAARRRLGRDQHRRRGLPRAARRRARSTGARAAVVGAGGSARSVVARPGVARGARVGARPAARGRRRRWPTRAPASARPVAGAAGSWDLLVNTTPVGTHPDVDDRRSTPATARRRGWSTTSSTTRGRRGCCATPRPPAAGPSTASTCSSPRPSASSLVDRRDAGGACPPRGRGSGGWRRWPALEATARTEAGTSRMKQTTFEEFVELATRGTFVPGLQGDPRRPADAGVGVPQGRRARRLRLPARERRGRRAASRATRSSARIRSSCCGRATARP